MGLSFYLYILKCCDSSLYIGHTDDIEKRLTEHHLGLYENYTSTRRPVELVYMEAFPTRVEAVLAEKKLKKWSRAKKEAFVKGDWKLVSSLAKRKSSQDALRDAGAHAPAPQGDRCFSKAFEKKTKPDHSEFIEGHKSTMSE